MSCSRYLSARLTSSRPRAIEGCDRRLANDVPQNLQTRPCLLRQVGSDTLKAAFNVSVVKTHDCSLHYVLNVEWILPQPAAFQRLNFPPTDGWTSCSSAERSLCLSSSCVCVCVFVCALVAATKTSRLCARIGTG